MWLVFKTKQQSGTILCFHIPTRNCLVDTHTLILELKKISCAYIVFCKANYICQVRIYGNDPVDYTELLNVNLN